MNNQSDKLDHEWLMLIEEAKKLGLSVEEVRNFLKLQAVHLAKE
ncbi:anti-repressor SinI family protein [Halalkalibacter alkaliphilus]